MCMTGTATLQAAARLSCPLGLPLVGLPTTAGTSCEDCTKEARLLKTMRECSPIGVLIWPSLGRDAARTHRCGFMGPLPTVAFARSVDRLDYEGVNNLFAAELAVDRLYQIGHRRIAFVDGQAEDMGREERVEGYR